MLAGMAPTGAEVSFIEIGVSDPSKSTLFLEQMFGWKFHPIGQPAEGWLQAPAFRVGVHGGDPTWGVFVLRRPGPGRGHRRGEPAWRSSRNPHG
jgi:hypothetical protein